MAISPSSLYKRVLCTNTINMLLRQYSIKLYFRHLLVRVIRIVTNVRKSRTFFKSIKGQKILKFLMTPLQLFRKENLELVQKENPLLTKAQIRHKLMDKYKQLDKQVRQDYKKRAADISANESMAIKRAEELETGFKTMNGKDKQKAVTVVKTTKIPDTPILLVPDAVIQSTDKDTQTISVTLPAFEKASVENLNQIYWDCLRELQVENTHDSINIDEFVLTPPIGYGISNISDSIPDTVADSISIKKKRPFRPWEQEYDEYKLPKIKGNPDSEMLKLMRCINDGVQYIKTKIELKTQDLARSKAVSYTIGEVHGTYF